MSAYAKLLGYAGGPNIWGATAVVAGTSAITTLTFSGTITGGTFKLLTDFGIQSITADVAWSATNNTLVANILAALNALTEIESGDVTVAVGTMTAGIGTITVTAAQQYITKAGISFSVYESALTGTGTPLVAATLSTPGVNTTGRGATLGDLLIVGGAGSTPAIRQASAVSVYGIPTWSTVTQT